MCPSCRLKFSLACYLHSVKTAARHVSGWGQDRNHEATKVLMVRGQAAGAAACDVTGSGWGPACPAQLGLPTGARLTRVTTPRKGNMAYRGQGSLNAIASVKREQHWRMGTGRHNRANRFKSIFDGGALNNTGDKSVVEGSRCLRQQIDVM